MDNRLSLFFPNFFDPHRHKQKYVSPGEGVWWYFGYSHQSKLIAIDKIVLVMDKWLLHFLQWKICKTCLHVYNLGCYTMSAIGVWTCNMVLPRLMLYLLVHRTHPPHAGRRQSFPSCLTVSGSGGTEPWLGKMTEPGLGWTKTQTGWPRDRIICWLLCFS